MSDVSLALSCKKVLSSFLLCCRFTTPQSELYQATLDVHKSCLSLCTPGISLENIYAFMLNHLGQKLKDVGVLQEKCKDDIYKVSYKARQI